MPRKPKPVENLVLRERVGKDGRKTATYYYREQVNGRDKWRSCRTDDRQTAIGVVEQLKALKHNPTLAFVTLEAPKANIDPGITYEQYAQEYIDKVIALKTNEVTSDTARYALRKSMEFWGALPVASITHRHCEDLVIWLRKRGTNNSVRNWTFIAWGLCKRAVKDGLLKSNPWEDVSKGIIPPRTPRTRVLSPEEQETFASRLDPEFARALTVMTGSGLRSKELLGLEMRHLDFTRKMIDLTPEIVKGGKKARSIPMVPAVEQALRDQIEARKNGTVGGGIKFRPGRPRSERYAKKLFNFSYGNLKGRLRESVKATSKAYGLQGFTAHDARRTFGTRCATGTGLERPVPPASLQAMMGHHDISITSQFYIHLNDDDLKASMRGNLGLPTDRSQNRSQAKKIAISGRKS